jgi:uncharacterized protein (TIGR02452 family)
MNRSLFIPNVVFQPNDDFSAMISNVIVCAAPNWHEASKQGKATVDENDAALESRIRYVCDVAECARTDCMILGAFGCGVFEQDTERVASLFAKYLGRYNFERVVFALPDEKQYGEFAKVFSSQYHGHVDVQ